MTTVGIIGLGLIGGSVAKTLRTRLGDDVTIKGMDLNAAYINAALEDQVIDEKITPTFSNVDDCDCLFLCTDVRTIGGFFSQLSGKISPNCVVTDAASVKKAVMEQANKFPHIQFVGGHPMAGSERAGYEAATDFMFENAYYILTPSRTATDRSVEALTELVKRMKAIPVVASAEEHDRIVATISHLPHIAAAALVNVVRTSKDAETAKDLAAGGFKDSTRIASGDSRLWTGICLSNKEDILSALDAFAAEIDAVRGYLTGDEEAEFGGYLRLAKNFRDALPKNAGGKYADYYTMHVDIQDRPGTIAVVTTALGVNGVNIKNIGIVNSREYEGGVLAITFADAIERERAAELLRGMRFEVTTK